MNALLVEETSEIGSAEVEFNPGAKLIGVYRDVAPGSVAESRLVEQHIPLVKHIVGRLAISLPPHIDLQDIYSSGLVGLLNAVRNFDPNGGSSFATYARVRIRGAIFDELRKMDWVPRSVHEKARKIQLVLSRLEQQFGRVPAPKEVAEALGVTETEYEKLLAETQPTTFVCLDAVANSDEETESRHEIIADHVVPGPDHNADRKELARIVADRLEQLPEIQRKVLALYYFEDLRLREIAVVLGLTESRICQIHGQAIMSIKSYLRQNT